MSTSACSKQSHPSGSELSESNGRPVVKSWAFANDLQTVTAGISNAIQSSAVHPVPAPPIEIEKASTALPDNTIGIDHFMRPSYHDEIVPTRDLGSVAK